jgi:hypothetical protein
METSQIIAQIDAEILKLQQAKALLTDAKIKRGPGRPKNAESAPAKKTMSIAARARISAAQKARWAKTKRASKKQV